MPISLRHFLSWKPLFYDGILPLLRLLGPAGADAAIGGLGRVAGAWPPRRWGHARAIDRARAALAAGWETDPARKRLAANVARSLARDYPLDGATDVELADRFDVRGFEHVQGALARGRGLVLVGCHYGAYLAALHWLYRQGLPLRLLVQRPKHTSVTLRRWFDAADGPLPQPEFFLRRDLPPVEAARRVLRAHSALRAGMAVYLCGDIPWEARNARPGRFLGRERSFLAVWADLAAQAEAPVIPVFATHRAGGRYQLTFDAPWTVRPGDEPSAVARYLARLEGDVAADPAEAVAYLTWPCYGLADGKGHGDA